MLAADRRTRIIWAIECKDLSGAVTAAEITREMSDHFRAAGATSVTKHSERVDWLRERISGALDRLGIEDELQHGWRVHGLLVTGRPVIAPTSTMCRSTSSRSAVCSSTWPGRGHP